MSNASLELSDMLFALEGSHFVCRCFSKYFYIMWVTLLTLFLCLYSGQLKIVLAYIWYQLFPMQLYHMDMIIVIDK